MSGRNRARVSVKYDAVHQGSGKRVQSKRSRERDVQNFWNVDLPKDFPIDTKLLNSMTKKDIEIGEKEANELEDRDGMNIPLHKYPERVREEFFQNMDKLTDILDKKQKDIKTNLLKSIPKTTMTPIITHAGHKHQEVRLPKAWKSKLETWKESTELNHHELLTENEEFHLRQTMGYEAMENYLAPRLCSISMGKPVSILEDKLQDVDREILGLLGFDVDGVENIKTPSGVKFMLCYPVDIRSVFFIGLLMSCTEKTIPQEISKRTYTRIKWASEDDKNKPIVLNLKVKYLTHFYFACDCPRQ